MTRWYMRFKRLEEIVVVVVLKWHLQRAWYTERWTCDEWTAVATMTIYARRQIRL